MTNDPYRRNPARDVEQFAVLMVRQWVGDRGVVTDASKGHDPDFRIDYHDGRVALGEVKWHADETIQAMWGGVFGRERHQIVELESGRGQWAAHLVPVATIKVLYRKLPDLVDRLLAEGQLELNVCDAWPRGELPETARDLGLDRLAQVMKDEPSYVYLAVPGKGGAVPMDPDLIVDWVDGMIREPRYANKIAKLVALEADERHVFFMAGTATDFGQEQVLMRAGRDVVPTRGPDVSPAITHVWGISQFGSTCAVLWQREQGWATVPVPVSA